jgi:hypothetical protein
VHLVLLVAPMLVSALAAAHGQRGLNAYWDAVPNGVSTVRVRPLEWVCTCHRGAGVLPDGIQLPR